MSPFPQSHSSMNLRQQALDDRTLFVSCVVPVYNEEAGVRAFVSNLEAVLKKVTDHYEILLIDDGSKDQTSLIIKENLLSATVKWIQFSRNFGKEVALTAGLHHAKGDVVILMDADFQHPFETIESFLTAWAQGYDMVYGVRADRQDEGFVKRQVTGLFYRLLSRLSKTPIPADAGDFRLLDRKVTEALNAYQEHSRFMKGLYADVGFRSLAVPYPVAKRQSGKSSFHLGRLFELALTGVISFSDLPLRVWSLVGLAISGIALIYAGFIIVDTLCYGADVPGYPTLIVCILFFGGIQLLSIGILGEYIARIFQEVKQRPLYIISDSHGVLLQEEGKK